MAVGIPQVELMIPHSTSLKDQRRVAASLTDRLHREHQASAAEVDRLDQVDGAVPGLTLASPSAPHCPGVLSRIVDRLRLERPCVLGGHRPEVLTGQ
jgi:uncharacterized protein YlxP (DUF503 family)